MGIRATTNENENENEPVWLGKEKENCLLRSARDGAVVNEKKEEERNGSYLASRFTAQGIAGGQQWAKWTSLLVPHSH
jgi:hypothetical protein